MNEFLSHLSSGTKAPPIDPCYRGSHLCGADPRDLPSRTPQDRIPPRTKGAPAACKSWELQNRTLTKAKAVLSLQVLSLKVVFVPVSRLVPLITNPGLSSTHDLEKAETLRPWVYV